MEATKRIIRIAITGPESSGKTTLVKALSDQFEVSPVPEYARQYLEENVTGYIQEDLDEIALGHQESISLSQNSINIIDTDYVVLKVWSEDKFEFSSGLINRLVSENHFDLHILCSPDIPWEEDPLRENPEDRHKLFEKYLEVLNKYRKDYIIVSGTHDKRLKKSIQAITAIIEE
jgi:NadR type nicotinamide-nucleotide adenylyltransferase